MKKTVWLTAFVLIMGGQALWADKEYKPKMILSDGKDGRGAYSMWIMPIADRPIKEVRAGITAQAGQPNKTFVNIRFEGQGAIDGRKYFTGIGNKEVIKWNFNGMQSKGRNIELRIYFGSAFLENVKIAYE